MLAGLVLAACSASNETLAIDTNTPSSVPRATASIPMTTPRVLDRAPPAATAEVIEPGDAVATELGLEEADPPNHMSEATVMTQDDEQTRCQRLTDFSSAELNQRWSVVNDNVMGGRSLGRLAFDAGILIFEGEIDTDGGGFSSLRFPLEPKALVEHDRIEFRARPDGRSYMVTFDDNLASRDRRVSHRAPIEFQARGEWQTVSVAFDDLFPAIFGRPIDDLAFRKDLASRMGLMISDGIDGPFRLEIDWIDLCHQ
jgi:hypothetical protein